MHLYDYATSFRMAKKTCMKLTRHSNRILIMISHLYRSLRTRTLHLGRPHPAHSRRAALSSSEPPPPTHPLGLSAQRWVTAGHLNVKGGWWSFSGCVRWRLCLVDDDVAGRGARLSRSLGGRRPADRPLIRRRIGRYR